MTIIPESLNCICGLEIIVVGVISSLICALIAGWTVHLYYKDKEKKLSKSLSELTTGEKWD